MIMKQNLRFRGGYCPKRIQPLYLLFIIFLLTGVGGNGAFAQTRLSGKVTDSLGSAIERATVHVKSTDTQTATDARGFFEITAANDAVLMVSALGYKRQEVPVMGQGSVAIILQPAANELEEVEINAGYYTTTRRTSTGNISRIDSETISQQPVNSPLAAMVGRMPGVRMVQQSGYAGSAFTVEIRGRNSLRDDGNDPLYIVNGVPFPSTPMNQLNSVVRFSNPLNAINPSDIESIEVLKDADATAIYGSRGANGVILITTKQGKAGQGLDVNVQVSTGFSRVSRFMELLDREQYLSMRREAFKNDGIAPNAGNAPDLLSWDTTRQTDWQRELIGGTGAQHMASASLSGGAGGISYHMAGTFSRETTVMPGDLSYRRGGGNTSLGYRSGDGRFSVRATINYAISANSLPTDNLSSAALRLAPNAPEPYIDGNLNWSGGTWDNPYVFLEQRHSIGTDHLITNLQLDYGLPLGLAFSVRLSHSKLGLKEKTLMPLRTVKPVSGANRVHSMAQAANQEGGLNFEPQLKYRRGLAAGTIDVMLGAAWQENRRDGETITAQGFPSERLMESLRSAEQLTGRSNHSLYRYQAVFGRIAYASADRYLLNLTFRRDGSSRFGSGKQLGDFGAVGAAWIFSEENAVKRSLPFLSLGKLRASYGTTGSDQIGDYGYLDTYTATLAYLEPAILPTRLANPLFGWERNRKLELAIDLAVLEGRFEVNAGYFRNRSSDQLVGYSLPAVTGFESVQANFPATVQNSGYEIEARSANLATGAFSWTTYAHLTLPYNRLLAFPDIERSSYNTLIVGEPRPVTRLYVFEAVDGATGAYRFKDLDASGNITATGDRRVMSRPVELYGGMENSLAWKGFSVSVFLQYVRRMDNGYRSLFGMPGTLQNQPVEVMRRWRASDDITDVARFSRGSTTAYSQFLSSTANFSGERSFIRLRNVAVSWQLPKRLCQALTLRQVALNLHGQNLHTWTKFKGYDPEAFTLPLPRTVVAGANVIF